MAKTATIKIGPEIDKKLYGKFSKIAEENGQSVRFVLERAMENYIQLIAPSDGSIRPQTGYYGTLVEEAAALMESLANNHGFLDGNKRISFAITDTFLRLNGFYLDVDPSQAHDFITQALGRSDFRFNLIREWISSCLKPL